MSEDKGKKDKKKESDTFSSSDSSTSSCTSQATIKTTLDSESTPADLLTFDYPVDSPPVRRGLFQVEQSEVQSAVNPTRCPHCKKRKSKNYPADDKPEELYCMLETCKREESSSAAKGAIQKQLKTLTTTKDKKCLLESDSSEQISETAQSQPETKPVLIDLGENKKRSSSLPVQTVPGDITSHTPEKRTKSEGAIKSPFKSEKSASPKKSPLKKRITTFIKTMTGLKDTKIEKQFQIAKDSEGKPEAEECKNERERAKDTDAGTAEAAAPRPETIDEETEHPSDHGDETPRRSSRRLFKFDDKSSGSPAKRKR